MIPPFKKLFGLHKLILLTFGIGLVACGGGSGGGGSISTAKSVSNSIASSVDASSSATSASISSLVVSSSAKSVSSLVSVKSWGTFERLEKMPNSYYGVKNPSLTSGLDGSVTLAWMENGIWAKQYTPADGWGAATKLNLLDNVDTISRGPMVAADRLGNVFAVWTGGEAGGHQVWVARYSPSEGWSSAISFDGNWAVSIALSVNKNGMATIAWLDWRVGENQIVAVQYAPDTGWGSPVKVASKLVNTGDVAVKLSEAGDVFLVWDDMPPEYPVSGELSLNYANYTAASGWSAPHVLVSSPYAGTDYNFRPELVQAVDGTVSLFWVFGGDLWSSKFNVGTGMSSPINLVDVGYPKNIQHFNAAIGGDGSIQLVWDEWHHANLHVLSTRKYSTSKGWEAIMPLVQSDLNWSEDVIITPTGEAQIFWAVQGGGVHEFDSIYLSADRKQKSAIQQVIYSAWGGLDMLQVTLDTEGNTWAAGVIKEGGETQIWVNKYK